MLWIRLFTLESTPPTQRAGNGVRRLREQWERRWCARAGGQYLGANLRLRREGFELQALDSAEVLGVGGQECEAVLEGGGADRGIGQAHAVRERQRIDQVGGALRDGWRDGQHLGVSRGQPLLQSG